MNPEEVLIPIGFFLSVALIWGMVILTRHKERMTIIDKGLNAEDVKAMYSKGSLRVNPLSSLKWGIIFLAIGLAAIIGMWIHANYYIGEEIIPALMAIFGGLGLITFYGLAAKKVGQ